MPRHEKRTPGRSAICRHRSADSATWRGGAGGVLRALCRRNQHRQGQHFDCRWPAAWAPCAGGATPYGDTLNDLVMTGATADELWPLVRDCHYSKRMSGLVRHAFAWRESGGMFGDTGKSVAGITYFQPVNRNFCKESLELSRLVRADGFSAQISEFVSWSLRWLKANSCAPFVLSYADTTQGHHGGIYQATGFNYIGATSPGHIGFKAPDGSFVHGRICNSRFGTRSVAAIEKIKPAWVPVYGEAKHLYIFPLRQKWPSISRANGWTALPYPKPKFAACPLDERVPTRVSKVQPLEAAPTESQAS